MQSPEARTAGPAQPTRTEEQRPLLNGNHTQEPAKTQVVAGGTVLGIHNLAIVMPQFIVSYSSIVQALCRLRLFSKVALVTSAIFRAVDGDLDDDPTNHDVLYGRNGVAWVLRFGGACTLIG
jgi:solute carrier family 45, member 1/2/4